MRATELEMINFDHSIPDGMAEALKAGARGGHSGWNFHGQVWWDGEQYVEEVWVYGSQVGRCAAPTLKELMQFVNDEYGWE